MTKALISMSMGFLMGLFPLLTFAAPSSAALFLNKEYQANLKRVPIEAVIVPSGAFLSSFQGHNFKNEFYAQFDANKKVHGLFIVASGSDGSILATGRAEHGAVIQGQLYVDESEKVFQKNFDGEALTVSEEAIVELSNDDFRISPERELALRKIADDASLKKSEQKPKLVLKAKKAVAEVISKISGRIEKVEFESEPTSQIMTVEKTLPVKPTEEVLGTAQEFFADAKSFLESDPYVPNLGNTPSGLDQFQNAEVPMPGTEVITITDDFRGASTSGSR